MSAVLFYRRVDMTNAPRSIISAITLLVVTALPALAGPPLICFPFDTQGARTLPMRANGWHDTDPTYDVSRLVDDTVALLTPETPVIVRMETLRRATVYAATKPSVATALLATFEARARTATPALAPLADFDFGYLVETYRQGAWAFKGALPPVDKIDGYQIVLKALALRPDPQIEFAAAMMTSSTPRSADHLDHVRRALAAANENTLIAANAAAHGLGQ
jgi:hypothetical protein